MVHQNTKCLKKWQRLHDRYSAAVACFVRHWVTVYIFILKYKVQCPVRCLTDPAKVSDGSTPMSLIIPLKVPNRVSTVPNQSRQVVQQFKLLKKGAHQTTIWAPCWTDGKPQLHQLRPSDGLIWHLGMTDWAGLCTFYLRGERHFTGYKRGCKWFQGVQSIFQHQWQLWGLCE